MKQPLVSCIMPTANRQQFIPYAIDYFLHQDYRNAELIILDDGEEPVRTMIPNHPKIKYFYRESPGVLGFKRNFCCEQAKGEIIVHWDDDDWYAADWISKQVEALVTSGADITGLSNVNFFLTEYNKKWQYDIINEIPWVCGATLAYWKSFWKLHPFKEMNAGEDNDFIFTAKAKIHSHDYSSGYLGIIHPDNFSISPYENLREKAQVEKWLKKIEKPEKQEQSWVPDTDSVTLKVSCIMPTANRAGFIPLSINNFLKQDYLNKELIIIDDGEEPVKHLVPNDPRIHYFYYEPKSTIGEKRNIACEKASGELIMHWDDDDWYAADWISYQAHIFVNSAADICGLNQVQYYSPSLNTFWMSKNRNSHRPWLTGQSLIYRKEFWAKHRFKNLQIGEDDDFVRNNGAKIFAHNYYQGFLATLHPTNTSLKFFEDPDTKVTV